MELSIIVPVYNVEKYLDKSLESIRQQTTKDFEVILINDGSTDGSKLICERYRRLDSRFRIINIKNSGPAHARNVGIREAKGKYVGFVDSDDYIDIKMYETLIEKIENFNADIAICGLKYVDDQGKCIKQQDMKIPFNKLLTKKDIKEHLIKKYYEDDAYGVASLCNKIYRRKFLLENKLLIDEDRVRAEDYWFNMYAYCVSNSVVAINENFYSYVQRKRESVMSSFRENQFELFTKTRQELLNLNHGFGFDIDYGLFDTGFIQETSSYIIQLYKNKKVLNKERVISILESKDYQDAIHKSPKTGSKPIRLINYFLKKKRYIIVCTLYKLWAMKS